MHTQTMYCRYIETKEAASIILVYITVTEQCKRRMKEWHTKLPVICCDTNALLHGTVVCKEILVAKDARQTIEAKLLNVLF